MRTIILLIALAFTGVACQKAETTDIYQNKADAYIEKYNVIDQPTAEPVAADVVSEIEKTGLWTRDQITFILSCDMTPDEKYAYLCTHSGRSIESDGIETIARKFNTTGNSNANGSNAYWDCSPDLLAQTISQVGESCNVNAINNYLNSGTSAAQITLSDVLRAANGVNNTIFDSTIEIVDLVFEYEVSGGNWIVGAVVLYNGEEYLFSELIGDEGGLIYSPQDGGAYLFGPMPGGIVSVNITGLFEPPMSE